MEAAENVGYDYIERLEYANSGIYKGCLLNQMRHGPGVQTWSSTPIIIEGKQIPRFIKYEGEWKKDQQHGKGKFYGPEGEIYEGDWQHNMKHGEGK